MQNRTYQYFRGRPLYEFGFGLSYAAFAYSNLKLSSASLKAGEPLTVQVDVSNTSQAAGDEVAELYLTYPESPGAPIRALKGFERVHLAPGETRHLTITLDSRDLSLVTEQGEHIVEPGSYALFVGGSQPSEGARGVQAQFQISGEKKLPR
jgi:beta-glucosidase